MKNISIWLKPVLCFCLSLIVITLSSCTKDDVHESYGLSLSDYSYVFPLDGGDLTVTVTTEYPDGWEVDFTAAEWISKKGETDNTVTFTAAPNLTGEMPEVKVKFTAGELTKELILTQEPKPADDRANFFMTSSYIQAISPDGKLIVVYELEGVEPDRIVRYYTINTATDEKTLMLESHDGEELVVSVRAISNNGIMLGELSGGGLSNDVYIQDGRIVYPTLPGADWKNPSLADISADGTIIVGAVTDANRVTHAVKWVNGTPTVLSAPEESRVDEGSGVRASQAQAISPDGRFILGRSINNSSTNEAIFWKDGGEWQWLGAMETKTVEMTNMWGETMEVEMNFVALVGPGSVGQISPNGKYVTVLYQDWGLSRFGSAAKVNVPALFDIETEEIVQVIRVVDYSPNGGTPISVMNDGSVCYQYVDFITGYTPTFLYQNGKNVDCQAYLEGMFNTSIGPDVRIRMVVDDPMVAIGAFTHPSGSVISFYLRPVSQGE